MMTPLANSLLWQPVAPPVQIIAGAVLLAALAGKIALELFGGEALFVDAGRAGFSPAPLAHLAGAAVGLAVAALDQ